MKKIFKSSLIVALSLILSINVFVGCSKSSDNKAENENTSETVSMQEEESEALSDTTQNTSSSAVKSTSKTVKMLVTTQFFAVQGAAIESYVYDNNGYPIRCYYKEKCESCGYVSSSKRQALGNTNTSFRCPQCGNMQDIEINTQDEVVEVPIN